MKIVTGMLVLLVLLTMGYFVTIFRQLPSVGPNVASIVHPQGESVQMGLSSAEQNTPTPAPSPTPSPSPARKK